MTSILDDNNGMLKKTLSILHFVSPEEETRKACEAVASYLVLRPEDEVQNRNMEFYQSLDEVTEDMFVPRKVCVCVGMCVGVCDERLCYIVTA